MKAIDRQRSKMVPLAKGVVLEIGMGSALNLKHYDVDKVEMIWGLEPSAGMRRKAQSNLDQSSIKVKWLDLPSESIPLDDNSVDTVVLTYTLCTIADWRAALVEMKRVLKSDGKLIFSEHGKAPDEDVQNWQKRVNPIWKKLAGGCNLDRDIPRLIESVGFKIDKLEQCYVKGPKIATYQYFGTAHA
jgi:ubiquinone/menaquinone biosynthesis C-methylase UbiE